MIDLSIIIVSYNTKKLLLDCLRSVDRDLKNSSLTAEVIVVDNGSRDGSREFLGRDCHSARRRIAMTVILNEENLGFGGANNLGAKRARGRYLLFLNPDTEVKSGALTKMVRFMDENPEAGIASCRLVNPDGSFQPQGGYLPRLSTVAVWALFLDDLPILREILPSYQNRSGKSGRSGEFGWVGGTAMAVRRQAWEQLGGFDEKIFMYGEDVEICYRANKQGWRVMINPDAEIVHVGKASGGSWVAGEVRGLLYIFKKHKRGWEMPALKVILAAGMGLRWLIFGILAGNETLRRAYAEAFRVARR